jgi:hypothetical protein
MKIIYFSKKKKRERTVKKKKEIRWQWHTIKKRGEKTALKKLVVWFGLMRDFGVCTIFSNYALSTRNETLMMEIHQGRGEIYLVFR